MPSLERLAACLGWASQREAFISPHLHPGALLGCLDLLLLPPSPLPQGVFTGQVASRL